MKAQQFMKKPGMVDGIMKRNPNIKNLSFGKFKAKAKGR